jgi:arabinogalactan endo-1,4-beta-galactosidase
MRRKLAIRIVLLLLLAVTLRAQSFLSGADLSLLQFFQDRGISYRSNGVPQDAILLLKNRGINCVRLRLFTSSAAQAQADPYDYTNNLAYTLPLAVRVKNAGLKLLLDFHFSDTWADPAHQAIPAAWTNFSFAQLTVQMRSYCSNTIAAFAAAAAVPDYVQVGNEITSGTLWTDGEVGGAYENTNQWSQLGQLLKAAIQGVKDAAGAMPPKIIIHLDRGGDWATTQWFFDSLNAQGVPFDIIGQSYYPFWHGPLANLQNCLTSAVQRYNKPVIIAETGFPFANSTNLVGFPATTNGQVNFVGALAQIVKGLPGQKGLGIFWWGAEYQTLNGYNLAGFDQRSLFGPGGNALPAADALGQLSAPVVMSAARTNGGLQLRGPLSGAGMTLQSAAGLASAGWQSVANPVQGTNGVFSVNLPLNAGTRFYRLKSN